jgi:WD40 repeat protein
MLKDSRGKEYLLDLMGGKFSSITLFKKFLPKSKLSVFISSTFTDSHNERNLLNEKILPDLQELYGKQEENLQITFSDMRFGVKDDNTANHLTWICCSEEIQRCFEESCYHEMIDDEPDSSASMFFLSLQADKYGYEPLPKYCSKELFEERINLLLADNDRQEVIELAKDWYRLDENNLSPVYVLQRQPSVSSSLSSSSSSSSTDEVFRILKKDFFGDIFCDAENETKINRSITEWEMLLATSLSRKGCYWVRKTFDQTCYLKGVCGFSELTDIIDDPLKKEKHKNLLVKMETDCFPQENILSTGVALSPVSYLLKDESYQKYLDALEISLRLMFVGQLEKMKKRIGQWKRDELGYGLKGKCLEEILHHCTLAHERNRGFIGRETLVNHSKCLLFSLPDNEQGSRKPSNELAGISFYIVGNSGTGKTSLMARLASLTNEELTKNNNQLSEIPVVIRFCGTSEQSLDGLQLMQSICIQILSFYYQGKVMQLPPYHDKQSFDEALQWFRSVMSKYPVYLFLDSLDQLSNLKNCRSHLSFLCNLEPHKASRIIVSTLPDERDPITMKWKYHYHCESMLKKAHLRKVVVGLFDNENKENEDTFLRQTMELLLSSNRSRKLTEVQMNLALTALKVEPSILYMNLSVEILKNWESFTPESELSIQPTVKGILGQIFENLERFFGVQLVIYAFAFLTYSREGINDIEMQDLLSLKNEVLFEVFQYSRLEVTLRLPIHLWYRLKAAIQAFITDKSDLCFRWYHRQIQEAAEERYKYVKIEVHQLMANYFSDKTDSTVRAKRLIHSQPITRNDLSIWLKDSIINTRRCEGLFHMYEGGMFYDAIDEMCCLDIAVLFFLSGKGVFFTFLHNQIKNALDFSMFNCTEDKQRMFEDYRMLYKRESFLLHKHPRNYLPLFASTCPSTTISNELHSLYRKLSFGWENEKPVFGRQIPSGLVEDNVEMSFPRGTDCLAWHPNGRLLACAWKMGDISVLDTGTGEVVWNFKAKSVECMLWVSSGEFLISVSLEGIVQKWDVESEEEVWSFQSPEKSLYASASFNDGCHILVGNGKTIYLLDILTGMTVTDLQVEEGIVRSIAWSCDGLDLAVAIQRKQSYYCVEIWECKEKKVKFILSGHTYYVKCVAFHPKKDDLLASCSDDNTIKLWNPKTGKLISTLRGHSFMVESIEWHRDNDWLLSCSSDKTVRIWDCTSRKLLHTFYGHTSCANHATWHPQGRFLASCGYNEFNIWFYDHSKGTEVQRAAGHRGIIRAISWHPNENFLASSSADRTIKIWSIPTGSCVSTLSGHAESVVSLAWNPVKSHLIASGSERNEQVVKIWDYAKGATVFTTPKFEGPTDLIYSLAWHPDGDILACGSGSMIQIWNMNTFQFLKKIFTPSLPVPYEVGRENATNSLAFNPNGKLLAGGFYHDRASILDFEKDLSVAGSYDTARSCSGVAWHPCKPLLAYCCKERSLVSIMDIENSKVFLSISAAGNVNSIAWHPNGRLLASCGDFRGVDDSRHIIQVWDIEGEGALVRSLLGHKDEIVKVAWNSDGTILASCSRDCSIIFFTVS